MKNFTDCPKARGNDILVQDLGDELVVYDQLANKAVCLNRLAAAVWQRCDGQTSLAHLAASLVQAGGSPEPTALRYVLDELQAAALLASSPLEGPKIGRREVVAKLGVGAAALLACVTSMIVPEPASAASQITGATGPMGTTG